MTTNDYPSRSLRDGEEGTTAFRLFVGTDGRVTDCQITSSSGYSLLDAATCSNVMRRARFEPALDDEGNPTLGSYGNRVSWRIPAAPSYAEQIAMSPTGPQAVFGVYTEIDEMDYPLEALEKGQEGSVEVDLTISPSGAVTQCTVAVGSGNSLLDEQSCNIAKRWSFLPARDAAGTPIEGKTKHEFGWELPDAWKDYQRTGLYPKKPI